MNETLQKNLDDIDKDLAVSWIDLSANVRDLTADLKLKAIGSALAADADHLFQKTSQLCNHVERMHADVIDLLENIETRMPLPERDASAVLPSTNNLDPDEIDLEKIQIQRESHELRNNFTDVLKALFMWVDDPKQRVRERNQ